MEFVSCSPFVSRRFVIPMVASRGELACSAIWVESYSSEK